ncbi:hypothetical protein [Sphingobacterium sp. JB170]|uniref:hypothetical protein n=1 Tax=Sphingobacterium sp. JB170 TaxID=1434842 RepID=UPI00097ECCD1|nr:hypothetical protein [Sphingobacterium sp. JB170]SJN49869.1 hypothetical protein FM107_19375 [Sphingobacterium sp. JB170]
MRSLLLLLLLPFSSFVANAQENVVDSIITEHKQTFSYRNNTFSGEALDTLVNKIAEHRYILIGEQHHTNEVPLFVTYLMQKIEFDNYIMEGNQFVTNLLEKTLKKSEKDYNELITKYPEHLGFYTFSKDRKILETFLLADKNVIELDQVYGSSDGPILNDLINITENNEAKTVYRQLLDLSESRWEKYKQNPNIQPPFNKDELPLLGVRELTERLQPLLSLNLSSEEERIIHDLVISDNIYALVYEGSYLRSHDTRISLMKKNLLNNYDKLVGKRNLFKFGANHVTKHKSLSHNTPDVGNMALNLADAEGQKSLHIAVMEKSGSLGAPFGEDIATNGAPYLKPFLDLTTDKKEWLLFDLNKVRNEATKKKITMGSTVLTNFIEGFDYLIVIPEVTPQTKL